MTTLEQVEHRLPHADVSFDPYDQQVVRQLAGLEAAGLGELQSQLRRWRVRS